MSFSSSSSLTRSAGRLRSRLAAKAPMMSNQAASCAGDRLWTASETPRQTPDQVVYEGAAKFARQAVKSRVRWTAGKYADKGRGLRLNARDPPPNRAINAQAVPCSAGRVQFLVRQPQDAILKLFDQRGDDVVLGFEELIDRADRDLGAFRRSDWLKGRRNPPSPNRAPVAAGDVSHPLPAARLGGKLAQAGALAACRIGMASPIRSLTT